MLYVVPRFLATRAALTELQRRLGESDELARLHDGRPVQSSVHEEDARIKNATWDIRRHASLVGKSRLHWQHGSRESDVGPVRRARMPRRVVIRTRCGAAQL